MSLFVIYAHTHAKRVRARAFMTKISFINLIRPARMTLRVISAIRANISKTVIKKKRIEQYEKLYK